MYQATRRERGGEGGGAHARTLLTARVEKIMKENLQIRQFYVIRVYAFLFMYIYMNIPTHAHTVLGVGASPEVTPRVLS